MVQERVQRRLAAILAADMVGYSRLMRADEEGTIERQKALRRDLIDPEIAGHGGRIVKTMGDGLLVEFPSVVDAVKCAVAVQEAMTEREATIPEDLRIRYRVGINLGDIVIEDADIVGDGVNVAARLEGLAEPGGLCISDLVYRSAHGGPGLRFEDLGDQQLKNIPEPVRVWRWRPEDKGNGKSPEVSPGATPALPDKPSIAVLPFTNMSGDPEQEYFADGMAEDIITELSRLPWFFVIARNSSFTYKGQPVDVTKVGRELGVAYVLEGSVRKAGNRLRINAQLIDAETGNHIWAERYDREIADIFDIQDEINQAIINAVAPELVSAEQKKTRQKDPAQLSAWECVMRGRAHVWKLGREDARIARRLFEQAIALSPGSGLGASDLALVHFLDAFYGWSRSREQSFKDMVKTAENAVAIDDTDPMALTILSWAYTFAYQWDEALSTIDRAIALSPNFAPAIGLRGAILACADEPDLAIATVREAIRLSPRDGFMPYWLMGLFWAYHSIQDYEQAVLTAQHAVRVAPDNPTFRRQLLVANHMLGRKAEAAAALADYLALDPKATVDDSRIIPSRNKQHLERYIQILIDAGVPEKSA
ncbi:adenylate/guanylate cyclase domain-containing protein [Microbaculum sp. FT89]|uniref:adenylate/guanylate cyclase domain-containing protein n=1 Tax=Microbaculum sp. FT89 TaxID=3447298 RepID=UPI003F5395F5